MRREAACGKGGVESESGGKQGIVRSGGICDCVQTEACMKVSGLIFTSRSNTAEIVSSL